MFSCVIVKLKSRNVPKTNKHWKVASRTTSHLKDITGGAGKNHFLYDFSKYPSLSPKPLMTVLCLQHLFKGLTTHDVLSSFQTINIAHHINRPSFALHIGPAEILSQNADAQELQPSKEENQTKQ